MQQYTLPLLGNFALASQLYASIELPQSNKMHTQVIYEHA